MQYHTTDMWSRFWCIMALLCLMPVDATAQLLLWTDAGRVKHAMDYQWRCIWIDTRGPDWNTFGRGHKFFYPQDEWNSGSVGAYFPDGVLEQVIRPGATNPALRVYYQQNGWNVVLPAKQWKEIKRNRPPLVMVGRDFISLTPPYSQQVDPLLPANQAVVLEVYHRDGVEYTHTHYGFENPDLDRSVIHHWHQQYTGITTAYGGAQQDSIITLPSGQVLTYWMGHFLHASFARSQIMWAQFGSTYARDLQDDYGDWMESPSRYLTSADAPRAANLQILYVKDAQADNILDYDSQSFDDTGDPFLGTAFTTAQANETGEFLSDKIVGTSYFHFDRTGDDHTDYFNLGDPAQSAPRSSYSTRAVQSAFQNYSSYGAAARWALYTGVGLHKSTYRNYFESQGANTSGIHWTGVTEAMTAGAPAIPQSVRANGGNIEHMHSGPYVLEPGQGHDKIFSIAAADFPRKESQELGRRYLKWIAQQKPGVHPNGDALGPEIVPLSNLEKFQILENIKDTLFQVVDKSFAAWHGGPNNGLTTAQKIAGEGFRRMPDAPPAPDIWIVGGPDRVDVHAWYPDNGMFEDVDTGVDDFKGYRIYRKEGRPDVNYTEEIIAFGYLDWTLVGEVRDDGAIGPDGQPLSGTPPLDADHYNVDVTFPDGTERRVMRFFDNTAQKGKDYYYAITCFDDGTQNLSGFIPGNSLEGDRVQAATGKFGTGQAVSPFSPGLQQVDSVVVVPNPWALDLGAGLYSGVDQNKIMFDKLPRICTLKIYTETGDLVQTIEHTNQSAQEYWYQQTHALQLVKSGIYILAVLDAKQVDPLTNEVTGSLPSQFVKFVIIR